MCCVYCAVLCCATVCARVSVWATVECANVCVTGHQHTVHRLDSYHLLHSSRAHALAQWKDEVLQIDRSITKEKSKFSKLNWKLLFYSFVYATNSRENGKCEPKNNKIKGFCSTVIRCVVCRVYCVCSRFGMAKYGRKVGKCLRKLKENVWIAKEYWKCVGLHRKNCEFWDFFCRCCCYAIAFFLLVLHAYNMHEPATTTVISIIIARWCYTMDGIEWVDCLSSKS